MADLMEVRTALATTTNNNAWAGTTGGGAEINKMIDKMIVDSINRGVDLRPLISRKPVDQLSYFWNLRTDLSSTTRVTVAYSQGGTGTPYPSTKRQLIATCINYRSDYEVTGLMLEASRSYYDAVNDEAQCGIDELKIAEERMMICGDVTGAYGIASAFNGLQKMMRWNDSNGGDTESNSNNQMGDTTALFGITRSASTDYMDVSYVIAGTAATATGVLELKHLDEAVDRSDKHGGKGNERIFFCSVERGSEINRLLQPQQRFSGTLQLEGGMTISTYRGIPIVTSRFMDKNGCTNTSSWDKDADGDYSMYLLDLDNIEMRILNGVDAKHTPITGSDSGIRYDVVGGYFKTYGIFVMKRFCSQVNICNLTAPA